jgi:hypothetical protein
VRVLILALSVLGILVSADAGKAGPSTATRDLSTSVDPAIFADEATQETEDRIGLDKRKRRDVQRRLTGLGFDTKVNGRFDESTRAVITRLAGGTRLSQDWLPQHAPASGATDRVRLSGAGQLQEQRQIR